MEERVIKLLQFLEEEKEKAIYEKNRDKERNFRYSESYWNGAELAFSDVIKKVGEIFKD
ncbi:MAG: hypothetical protein KDD03_02095 [Gelidibacter sp.]|nr:hypothetical protein [Gelidibacter sp.]